MYRINYKQVLKFDQLQCTTTAASLLLSDSLEDSRIQVASVMAQQASAACALDIHTYMYMTCFAGTVYSVCVLLLNELQNSGIKDSPVDCSETGDQFLPSLKRLEGERGPPAPR